MTDQPARMSRVLGEERCATGARRRQAYAGLRVLVVDSTELQAHVLALLQSPRDSMSVPDRESALRAFREWPCDIALLAVEKSLLHVMRAAAGMRAIERELDLPRPRVAIIACTSRAHDYRDCLVAGTGLSGVLNAPWTLSTVRECLSRWQPLPAS